MPRGMMKSGFYTIMAAQFFSSLADNALLIAAIKLLYELSAPEWMTPALKLSFVVSYVVLAPVVGAFAYTWLQDTVARSTDYWRAALGGVILLLVLAFPRGIAGSVQQLALRLSRRAVPGA